MAVLTPRVVLACTLPAAAVVTLLTIFWTRRRRWTASRSTSTRKIPLVPSQENVVDDITDSCENKNVLKVAASIQLDGSGHPNESFEEHYGLTVEVSNESVQAVSPIEETCIKQEIVAVETEYRKKHTPECVHKFFCQEEITSEESLPDLSVVTETEVSKQNNQSEDLIQELQEKISTMHVRFDEDCQAAKIEQDCPSIRDEGSAIETYERESPVNVDELCCGDKESTQDYNLSEVSRDSAMGGEEEDIVSTESSVHGILDSTPRESYSSRTEFEEELFAPKSRAEENGDSECFNDLDEVLESPPHSIYSDEHSEGSCDSGKGGSDIHVISSSEVTKHGENALLIYEFEVPQDLCGLLIGRFGKHVNSIKSSTNASVFIKKHPFNLRLKLCALQGTKLEIENALDMIRKRFPLSQYPAVTLVQVNVPLGCGVIVPETLQLNLPEGVMCDVILSSMVSAGHFFIQQPTHPTYPSLNRLDMCMTSCYTQLDTPEIPHPVEVGVICACPILEGWFRAQVVNLKEDSEDCDVKFVDYGGYSCVPLSRLKQIRSDFMTLPFQASECYLANVTPTSESWSLEACATFEELAQGQILQALVVGHAEDGIPYVHLYRVQGVSTVFINRELVNRGVAQWLEIKA